MSEEDKRLVFRSYVPKDDIADTMEEIVPLEDEDVDVLAIEQEHEEMLKQTDVASLAPKRDTQDLKRDLAPKLKKLDFLTHKAIIELAKQSKKAAEAESSEEESESGSDSGSEESGSSSDDE
eukprot:TRINITY_DN17825_c0_g1_i1.p2 TRINITY_DN17825_c0_g1~~TRINITY_DN17825_c0_g1_i1.p2  ORF type:complete len:122 (-),score=40.98 TRINITY_DN17825_c0_g1_i1:37-402(-)